MKNKKKLYGDYYLGLDIGTNSVGWAVTNERYKVCKFNKKSMWGVRMFDEAKTAEDTRLFRTSRRRYQRRRERLATLQAFFKPAIDRLDPNFFTNLAEGRLQADDRTTEDSYRLFNDEDFTDKDYYKKYPTIYHLRQELMKNPEPHDVRLVYLALHHILKYRGHFLLEGDFQSGQAIEELLAELNALSERLFAAPVFPDIGDSSAFQDVTHFLSESMSLTDKKNGLKQQLGKNSKNASLKKLCDLLAGGKVSLSTLFENFTGEESLEFRKELDERDLSLQELTGDEQRLLEVAKLLYDWGILQNILDGEENISQAKIKSYNKYREQLKELKVLVKKYLPEHYRFFFHTPNLKNLTPEEEKIAKQYSTSKGYQNYASYMHQDGGEKCSAEKFKASLKKLVQQFPKECPEKESLLKAIDDGEYLVKQRKKDNGVIPRQVHQLELEKILGQAKNYLPFLNEEDQEGHTVQDKIKQLFTFRIPYYVGPLNPAHKDDPDSGYAWVVRKKAGKVYPWNFEEMVDIASSAKNFIRRMTSPCTYLFGEDVLPKDSLLYQEYLVLNALNMLCFNGERITATEQEKLFQDLFIEQNIRVTKKRIDAWYRQYHGLGKDDLLEVTGIDEDIKGRLTTYHQFKAIFPAGLPKPELLENCVLWGTLFGETKPLFQAEIEKHYQQELTPQEIKALTRINFSGWGKFSQAFLTELQDTEHFLNGPTSIIEALRSGRQGQVYILEELLSGQFDFMAKKTARNQEEFAGTEGFDMKVIEDLVLSPAVKRAMWQSLRLVKEIRGIMGYDPKRIFIEMARGGGKKGQKATSRREFLAKLYKSIKVADEVKDQLDEETDANLRRKKIFLYYLQQGKCLYSGEAIDYHTLLGDSGSQVYDIDHIIPRSIKKDDSYSNLALVKSVLNRHKSNVYPLEPTIQKQQKGFWLALRQIGLMSKQKFARLVRTQPLSMEEKAGFIARQLVETHQSSKALKDILTKALPKTKVIPVKAHLVSEFRAQQKNKDKDTNKPINPDYRYYIKVRSLNDLHHAKDAYLNIIVGNVYYTKFTSNPLNFLKKDHKPHYNLARMFDFDIQRGQIIAWRAGLEGTIKQVNRMMKRHDALLTWQAGEKRGGLFEQTIQSKGQGQIRVKKDLPIEKYGGYTSASPDYYAVFQRKKGNRKTVSLLSIPRYMGAEIQNIEQLEKYAAKKEEADQCIFIKGPINPVNCVIEYKEKKGEYAVRARITSRSDNRFNLANVTPAVYSVTFIENYKHLEKLKNQDQLLEHRIRLNDEEMLAMYDEILKNLDKKYFKGLLTSATHKHLWETRKAIAQNTITVKKKKRDLDRSEKAALILETVKAFDTTSMNANLESVGKPKTTGRIRIPNNLSSKTYVHLINQSVTGLFENRVVLYQS